MSIIKAFNRVKKRRKCDNELIQTREHVVFTTQDPILNVVELNSQFTDVRRRLAMFIEKKNEIYKLISPLAETFTDTWSKQLQHVRKRGRVGINYTPSAAAQKHLDILIYRQQATTYKRRSHYLQRRLVDSEVAEVHKQLLQLVETVATLSPPCQIQTDDKFVLSNDFKALIPNNISSSQHHLITIETYDQLQDRLKDIEQIISDSHEKISKLFQDLGNDDSEHFSHVKQREFKYEHQHEQFSYTMYCLCHFCTDDMAFLNNMLQ
jgi:hypothetical protein